MSVSQVHSPYSINIRKAEHTDYPADLLKFNAWKNPVENFEEAVNIIIAKKLVLGEPAVVPFSFEHADGSKTLELAFGIGSADIDHPFIKCSITNDIINDAIIVGEDNDGNPTYDVLINILNKFISKDEAQEYVNEAVLNSVRDENIINQISLNVANSSVIENKVESYLRWKPLTELLR